LAALFLRKRPNDRYRSRLQGSYYAGGHGGIDLLAAVSRLSKTSWSDSTVFIAGRGARFMASGSEFVHRAGGSLLSEYAVADSAYLRGWFLRKIVDRKIWQLCRDYSKQGDDSQTSWTFKTERFIFPPIPLTRKSSFRNNEPGSLPVIRARTNALTEHLNSNLQGYGARE
jgi:hypothetical protein